MFLAGSLLTPLAGAAVETWGVEEGFRLIAWLALASPTVMYTVRQALLAEPPATRLVGASGGVSYREVTRVTLRNRRLLCPILVNAPAGFTYPMACIPLYLTDGRAPGLDPGLASAFPTMTTLPSILLLLLTPRLGSGAPACAIRASYMSGASGMLLAAAPGGVFEVALVVSALDSLRYVASFALARTYLNNSVDFVDPKLRARLLSLATTLSAPASLPAPAVSGPTR